MDKPAKANEVVAFVDTNYCVHFKLPHLIDWRTELDAQRVRLVVVGGVIAELDEHKYTPKLSERANAWSGLMEACLDGAMPVKDRPGVTLELYTEAGDEKGDRNIAAQARQFIEEYGTSAAVFVTNDTNAAIAIHSQKIKRYKPKSSDMLPLPKSEDQKKILEAQTTILGYQKQLADIKHQLPNIDVTATGPDPSMAGNVPLIYTLKRVELRKEKVLYPKIYGYCTQMFRGSLTSSQKEYVDSWLAWCKSEDRVIDDTARTIDVWVSAKNKGYGVAEGLTITLTFPTGQFCAVSCDGYGTGQRSEKTIMPHLLGDISNYIGTDTPAPNININQTEMPYGFRMTTGTFKIMLPKLSHDETTELYRLQLTFSSWEQVGTFDIAVKYFHDKPAGGNVLAFSGVATVR